MSIATHQSSRSPGLAPIDTTARVSTPATQATVNPTWQQLAMQVQRASYSSVSISAPDDAHEREADQVADQIMRMHVRHSHEAASVAASPPGVMRACACGGGATCRCNETVTSGAKPDEQRIQPKRTSASTHDAAIGTDLAPRATAHVAGGSMARSTENAARVAVNGGTPLSSDLRAFFEPRFGRDLDGVRVRTDAAGATAARAIEARAYTLGQHVVFGAGEYAPTTHAGRRLLAHELTHVVQQSGGSGPIARTPAEPRVSVGPAKIQRDVAKIAEIDSKADALIDIPKRTRGSKSSHAVELVWRIMHEYFIAESTALWVNVVGYDAATMGLGLTQAGTGASSQGKISVGDDFLTKTTEATLEQRVADVARALKQIEQWRRGSAPPDVCDPARQLTWADFTAAVPAGGYTAYTGFDHTIATVGTEQVIKATFAGSRSYVQSAVKNPANRATSGCGTAIAGCATLLAGKTGVTLPLAGAGVCAAGVRPNPAVVATNSAECATVLGPECDRVRQLESDRLLRHERLHFQIACLLARKGTRALSLKPTESARILQAVKDKARELSNETGHYDRETDHSCNAAMQAAWEQSVAADMPMVTIT